MPFENVCFQHWRNIICSCLFAKFCGANKAMERQLDYMHDQLEQTLQTNLINEALSIWSVI